MMDGVPSRVNVLFADSVQSCVTVLFMDGVQSCVTGTRIARGLDWYKSYQHGFISISCLSTGATRIILVMAPELQEVILGTKDEIGSPNVHLYNSNLHLNQNCKRIGVVQLLVMSIRSISKFLNQNCKRCPSSSLCELKCV